MKMIHTLEHYKKNIEAYTKVLPTELYLEFAIENGTHYVFLDHEPLEIEPSRKILNKSIEFNWGYQGSGPAQLALAILLIYWPADLATMYYQEFKRNTIATIKEKSSFAGIINLQQIMLNIVTQNPVK